MKTIYQIVVKGLSTNRIYVEEIITLKEFKKLLDFYKNNNTFIIITTNQYYLN